MKTTINNTKGIVTYRDGNTIVLESPFGIEIKGDLTIAGTTTTNARVDDKLIELGYGATGSADHDSGIVVERGDDSNVFFGWDESADKFVVGTGTFTGTTTADLSFSPAGTSFLSVVANSLTGSNTITVPAGGLIIGSTAVTATAAELNAAGGGGGTAATVTGATQSSITSLPNVSSIGSLNSLIVDYVQIDNKTIMMIGTTNDTAKFTVGDNGALDIYTTDLTGADADITITADGTFEAIGTTITLDSGGAINLEPAAGSAILLDGTISVDAGVVTGATSITSTAFVGDLTGDVTGNCSGTAATVTTAAQTNITSLGTLTALTVDNVAINGTTIGHTGDTDLITLASGIVTVAGEISVTTLDIGGTNVTATAAELNTLSGIATNATALNYTNVTPGTGAASKALVLDSSRDIANINSLTATTLAGTLSTAAQTNITSVGTLSALVVSGDLTVDTSTLKVDSSNNSVGIGTATPNSQPDEKNDLVIGDLTGNRGMTIASAGTGIGTIRFARSASANDGEGWIDYSGNSKKMRLGTNGLNTRVTIDGSGNVGIGAGTPTEALDINSDAIRIRSSQTPATAGATGTAGMVCWDASYIYVCVDTNTWKRVGIAGW